MSTWDVEPGGIHGVLNKTAEAGAIPTFTGNLETLEKHAASLKTTASGIRGTGRDVHNAFQELDPVKKRDPKALPTDPEATHRLQEWLAEDGYSLFGIEHDFRGADLSGADFTSSWFTQAVLAGVRLAGVSFYRADLQSADLTGADLTGADLVRANLDEAVLRSARLDGADMVKASLHGVDASGASFRGTRIMGASLFRVDLRGADLTDAVLSHNSFRVTVDDARWCVA